MKNYNGVGRFVFTDKGVLLLGANVLYQTDEFGELVYISNKHKSKDGKIVNDTYYLADIMADVATRFSRRWILVDKHGNYHFVVKTTYESGEHTFVCETSVIYADEIKELYEPTFGGWHKIPQWIITNFMHGRVKLNEVKE